ncbi:M24 family metallopeptidase [Chakrabartyella piscis]|uniref:M24 family metallopeptidase n=1 Tax=Chakrabartyella piscis TaxID=2918914 RepID=UPI002958BD46|nr:M24 family metallopeptidase [Chakrabartyella piscis]
MAKSVTHIKDIRHIESIVDFLQEKKGETLGLCGVEKLPGFYRKHLEQLEQFVIFRDCELFFAGLRLYKDDEEIEKIITAAFYANNIMQEVSGNIKEGITTEREIANKAEYLIKTKGLDVGYDTIVSGGLNTRENTHRPTDDHIHEVVTVNIVPRYKGYSSFYTITKGLSNSESKKVCESSKKVISYMLDNLKVGDSTERIFELYQEKTREFGLLSHLLPLYNKEEFVGCSTGLEPVEYPYLCKDSHLILKKGMVLSLKYYLAGFSWGDVKFEFNVLIDDKPILLNDIYMD